MRLDPHDRRDGTVRHRLETRTPGYYNNEGRMPEAHSPAPRMGQGLSRSWNCWGAGAIGATSPGLNSMVRN